MARLSNMAWCGAVIAAAASAQPVPLPFFDDFETGTLTTGNVPPGRWNVTAVWSGNNVAVVDAGAHDRGFGFRATDAVTTDVDNYSAVAYQNIVRAAGDRYLRQWVRVIPASPAGTIWIGLIYDSIAGRSVCDIGLGYPSAHLYAGASNGAGWFQQDTGVVADSGVWRLIECGLTDAGTAGAELVMWIDGVERARGIIDQTGVIADSLAVGEEHSNDGPFRGTIDIDDYAVTATPPPSRVRIDAGAGTLAAGVCVPVQIELYSSSGVTAGALRPELLSVSSTGATASVFSNGSCSSSAGPSFAAGQAATVLGVMASPGTLTLTVQAGDLLGDTRVFAVTDGGGPAPLALDVGCGCATAPTELAILMGALIGVRRRRR